MSAEGSLKKSFVSESAYKNQMLKKKKELTFQVQNHSGSDRDGSGFPHLLRTHNLDVKVRCGHIQDGYKFQLNVRDLNINTWWLKQGGRSAGCSQGVHGRVW